MNLPKGCEVPFGVSTCVGPDVAYTALAGRVLFSELGQWVSARYGGPHSGECADI